MPKKKASITIDEDILKLAKAIFPNFSQTIEDILKEILDLNNSENTQLIIELKEVESRILELKQRTAVIRKLINKSSPVNIKEIESKEKDRIWRRIYSHGRETQCYFDEDILNQSASALEVETETLVLIIKDCMNDKLGLKINSWNYIKDNYPKKKEESTSTFDDIKYTDEEIEQMKRELEERLEKEGRSKRRFRR